jgi:hypothetical protein
LEALKIKTREMRVFVRVTAHQGPQKWISRTHQKSQICFWNIQLRVQMLLPAPWAIFNNLEALRIKTQITRVILRVTENLQLKSVVRVNFWVCRHTKSPK